MPTELISFWRNCELKELPFAHPEDLQILTTNRRWLADDVRDFDQYMISNRFGNRDNQLHLSLVPVPYVGDLEHAEVVILLLNPGLGPSDYWVEYKMPEFRKRIEDNLRQFFSETAFPFLALDPKLCYSGAFVWWERKLREVIEVVANEKFKGNRYKAMQYISERIACVELVPYHSSSFGDHALIKTLPSVKAMRKFVSSSLLNDAKADKRTLIVTRQAREWGLETSKNVVVYAGGHTRGASLGVKTEGGQAILKRLGFSS